MYPVLWLSIGLIVPGKSQDNLEAFKHLKKLDCYLRTMTDGISITFL